MNENGHGRTSRFSDAEMHDHDTSAGGSSEPRGPEALHKLQAQIAELRDYATHLAAAKADQIKLTIRRIAIYAVLGIVGGLIGIVMIGYAATQLLAGIAGGLGHLFGERLWLGNLVTGLLVLTGVVLGVVIMMKRMTATGRKATLAKYEERRQRQRAAYGRDVGAASHKE